MTSIHLDDRACIRLNGEEAEPFLQNLITCGLPVENAMSFGGLLTPQGKVKYTFFLIRDEDGYVMDCAASQRDELVKRLMFYRLRAKVDIAASDQTVFAHFGENGEGFEDPRTAAMGKRLYRVDRLETNSELTAYHSKRIENGLPELGYDFESEGAFPHEALMDLTGGVDFKKGCYVGQEVVSRMEHRGTARSRFMIVEGASSLPPLATAVEADGKMIGQMGSSLGLKGLALVRLDRLSKALEGEHSITAGSVALQFSPPPLDGFPWPV